MCVHVFTVLSYPARFLGSEYFRNFRTPDWIFLRDRETIVAVPVRNWRGCFQPMIDVKDFVMLSGFVQPSNSTFSSDGIIHTSRLSLYF